MDLLYETAISRAVPAEASEKTTWTENYYSEVLSKSGDLKTDACCTPDSASLRSLLPLLRNIHEEVTAKYYGCGLVAPTSLAGTSVLDLGCGSGRDVFLLAQLVGPTGRVVGVDMTEAQLEVPLRLEQWHRQRFGYAVKNTQFVKGTMEALGVCLADAGVAVPEINDDAGGVDGAFDVLVSNCVVNLVPDKRAVMMEAFAALKEGGELYFSDVYASARVPIDLQQDSELWGECLSGALYWNDFVRLAKEVGFADPRLVLDHPIGVKNAVLEKKIAGRVTFYSATYRLFKLSTLEPDCEDYGQAVRYKGGVESMETTFTLDDHHTFPVGKVMTVCGNSYRMLNETRFAKYFDFFGDFKQHFGLYEGCGKTIPFASAGAAVGGGSGGGGSCC